MGSKAENCVGDRSSERATAPKVRTCCHFRRWLRIFEGATQPISQVRLVISLEGAHVVSARLRGLS
jgi:hypothetical protein